MEESTLGPVDCVMGPRKPSLATAFLRSLVAAARTDVLELDHRWGSPRSGEPVPDFRLAVLLRGHARFLRNLMVDLKQPRFAVRHLPEDALLFPIQSKNQFDAVASIIGSLPNAAVLSISSRREGGFAFPSSLAFAIALLFWPILAVRILSADVSSRARLAHQFANFLLAYGYYAVGVMICLVARPRMLVVSNDHTMTTRSLAKAALAQGVRVAYVPHASVTEAFPRLEWDYAFLDGIDSLEKYERCGEVSSTVFLCGIPRFDQHRGAVYNAGRLRTLGVCLGLYDDSQLVEKVCASLLAVDSDLKIVVRPHPGDRRDWERLLRDCGVTHSDSTREDAFVYLGRVDAIVAGPSGIVLDAALMNVPSVVYAFGRDVRDPYGHARHGLAEVASDEACLLRRVQAWRSLDHLPNVRSRATRYAATVGSRFDGSSAPLVAETLQALTTTGVLPSFWVSETSPQGTTYRCPEGVNPYGAGREIG